MRRRLPPDRFGVEKAPGDPRQRPRSACLRHCDRPSRRLVASYRRRFNSTDKAEARGFVDGLRTMPKTDRRINMILLAVGELMIGRALAISRGGCAAELVVPTRLRDPDVRMRSIVRPWPTTGLGRSLTSCGSGGSSDRGKE